MLIVKVGGGDLDLTAIAADLASLQRPFVLLHGANRLRDQLANQLGRPPEVVESISGYTSVLSDDGAIDLLMATYAGIRNKRIVEALRREKLNAIGLAGLDGGLIEGERNSGIKVLRDGKKLILRDNSGKPRRVNGALLHSLLEQGLTPVITVPIAALDGAALNTENDEVLALLAAEVNATDVVSLIEAPGLLRDADDPRTVVDILYSCDLEAWEGRVKGRMRRKIRALGSLFQRAAAGSPRVRLSDGRIPRPVSSALEGAGTLILRRPDATGDGNGLGEPEAAELSPTQGSSSTDWLERQAHHELDVYGKRGLALVWGDGAVVRDADGREYLDCIGGHGALALGHRHPALMEALREQSESIWFVPGSFGTPSRTKYLERLHQALPGALNRTFLSNSGTEAIEAALKVARIHTGRTGFVGAIGGFHGRTMGALSVTEASKHRSGFEPLLTDVTHVPFNDAAALKAGVCDSTACVVLEPVQGESGVHIADPFFLQAARQICDDTGALLIFDEVQTGFGRTGPLFAFQRSGVVPDILCLAKSIAGGLPMGATVVREGVTLNVGAHGSTFGGNPLACAVAEATLDVLVAGDLLAGVEKKGARLAAMIEEADLRVVREVRQVGLMIGVQLRVRARPFLGQLQEHGVLALSAGSRVVRLLPPLVTTDEQIERIGRALVEVLGD